ncbi:SlyX protein [Orbus hercynius]|uniref:Protein SlyX homolog n=1 Tax=Orbus hercynius TaxID=593135 RepID=A0A495RF40_9GAMM|nr:SlyX family protein [Orbus hercynius]RKS86005.1 SlyX protein [Orbus hercynius]
MKNDKLSEQIERLETKVSFQELTIEELNQMVVQLQSDMAKIKEQLTLLSKKLQTTHASIIADASEETPPPHY